MKTLICFFSSLIIALSASVTQAREPGAPFLEAKSRLVEQQNRLEVLSGSGETFVFDWVPVRQEDRAMYESLSTQEQVAFQTRRANVLRAVSGLLEYPGLGFGLGEAALSRIRMTLRSKTHPHVNPIQELAEEMEALDRERKTTLRERVSHIKSSLLRGIDTQLASSSRLLASLNEVVLHVGLSPALGAALFGKTSRAGMGGVVLNLAYNHAKKGLVFEVVPGFEVVDRAFTPMALLSVMPKFGVTLAARDGVTDAQARRGNSFGPPVVPGYVTKSQNQISIGTNSGVLLAMMMTLVFQESPDWMKYLSLFGAATDFYSFTTKTREYVALRVTVSPLLPKFHQVQSGIDLRWPKRPVGRCAALF